MKLKGKNELFNYHDHLFRYNYDESLVEYVYKPSESTNTDSDGYVILDTVGLSNEHWNDKEAREEYLDGWIYELEEEASYLSEAFLDEIDCWN